MKLRSNPFLSNLRPVSLAASAVLSFAGLSSQSASAQANWVGGTSQDWNTAANWSTTPANPTGNFTINNSAGPGVFPVISANSAFTPVDVFVGTGGATGRLDHSAGTAATGNGNWFFVGIQGANATYNLANTAAIGGTYTGFGLGSGSFNVGGTPPTGSMLIGLDAGTTTTVNVNTSGTLAAGYVALGSNGSNGTNTFNLDNGTVAVSGEFQVGGNAFNQGNGSTNALKMSGGTLTANLFGISRGNNASNTMKGTVTLTGGILTSREWFTLGFAGAVGAESTVTNNGGTINVNSTGTGSLEMGVYDATTNTFTVGSGSVNLQNNASMLFGSGGNHTGTSTFTQDGGLVTFYSDAGTTAGGTGTLNLGTGGSSGTYAYNLNGGTLTVPKVQKSAAGASGTFNFNGGTLKAAAASDTFMQGLTSAALKAGGATIDTNGFGVTIAQVLTDDGGALTKTGAGTLTLSGANLYTGATTVSAGTLAFSTAQSSIGAVSVAAGAGLRVQSFGSDSTPLASASLALGSGSTLTFDFNLFNPTEPLINTSGAFSTAGTVAVSMLNGANLSNGAHTLIDYGSGGPGTFSGSPFSLSPRKTGTLSNVGTSLVLTVAGDAPRWQGGDNGNWQVGSTGANGNWRLIGSPATSANYIEGDVVLFNDLATGNLNINVAAANVAPASTTFNNSTSKNYTLGGAFGVAGTGNFTKSGDGSLVITNANTYTGATIIDAGATLTLGDGTTGKDGTIAGTSGVANEGTLAFNRFGSSTAGYVISGTGAVVKNGAGTQVLSGANTYSGETTVNAGILQLTQTASLSAEGTYNLAGGNLQINQAGNDFGYTPTLNLTGDGSTFSNIGAGQINFTGSISGNSRALNVSTTTPRLYMNAFVTDVTQFNVTGGAMGFDLNVGNQGGGAPVVVSDGAALWIANANAVPTNNLTLTGTGQGGLGALYLEGGAAPTLGGNIALTGNTTIGGNNAAGNMTLSGVISGSGAALTKTGANIYTLSGANTYTGGTTIAGGRLRANHNSAFGPGAVTVSAVAGAHLSLGNGVNVANAITINGGGTAAQGVIWVPGVNESATVSGPINITAVQAGGGHFAANGGTLTVSGPITSSVPVTVRLGTVVLSNTTSSYTEMQVISGSAKLGATNAIPVTVTPILGSGGVTGTLDLGGFNQTLPGVTQSVNAGAGSIITNTGGSDSTLTTTGTSTYIGVITNGPTHKVALNVASGALTLGGVNNTFTGNITVSGALTLADNAQLRFTPGPNTLVNSIGGNGTLTLAGDFVINTAGATVANGNTWTLVNVGSLTETFGETFSVVDFTENANVWTKVDGNNTWTFTEATGVLSLSVSSGTGYAAWAAANAPGQTKDQDHDNDGVDNGIEYFMGLSGSGFTANPALTAGTVTWTKGGSYTGTYGTDFVVQSSTDLVTWTNVPVGVDPVLGTVANNAGSVAYTPPTGQTKRFGRLVVNN